LSQLITFVGRIADRVVIGLFAGPSILGLYDSASRWSQVAFEQVLSPLNSVILATLNRARRSGAALGAAVARVLMPPMSVVVPLLGFLALETDIVVRTLLGNQWDQAVPFLRVLCGAAAANSVIKLARIVHLVTGSTKRQLRFAVFHMTTLVVAVLVGVQQGPMGVAWASLVASCGLAPVAVWNSTVDSDVRAVDIWSAVARPAAAVLCAVLLLRLTTSSLPAEAGVLLLMARAAVYGALYAMAWLLIPGGRQATRQLLALAQDLRGAR
jgi:PST family polysaccharide transporter